MASRAELLLIFNILCFILLSAGFKPNAAEAFVVKDPTPDPPKPNISVSRALSHHKGTIAPQQYLRSLCKQPRGLFRHPFDCHRYLDCWDGRVLEKQCPEGTVFSDLPGGFCDFPEYVECGDRFTTLKPEAEPTSTSTTKRPPCNHFQRPKPVTFIPEYELFNQDTNVVSSPFVPPPVPGLIKFVTENFYLFVRSKEVNFTTARHICQRLGLDLASIYNAQENQAIANQIRITEMDSPSNIENNGRYWIGAMQTENGFIWTSTARELTFSDWIDGQPDSTGKCVHFIEAEDLGWTTADCSTELRFICQWYPPKLEKRNKITTSRKVSSVKRDNTLRSTNSTKKLQVIRRRILRQLIKIPTQS